MPLPLIPIIWAAVIAAGLVLVVVAIIYYKDIIKWFQDRNNLKESDKDNIAFTIKQKLDSGDFKVVQGIFNKRTEDIKDGKYIQAKELDDDFAKTHGRKELVLYE